MNSDSENTESKRRNRTGLHPCRTHGDLRGGGHLNFAGDSVAWSFGACLQYRATLSSEWADTDDSDDGEDVTFQYNASAQAIEVTRGGTTYSLRESSGNRKPYVPSGGLTFTYYDRNGNVVAAGGNATQRASIHRINVVISVRGEAPPGYDEPTLTFSREVFLRNGS